MVFQISHNENAPSLGKRQQGFSPASHDAINLVVERRRSQRPEVALAGRLLLSAILAGAVEPLPGACGFWRRNPLTA
jgi:hypothetical protein